MQLLPSAPETLDSTAGWEESRPAALTIAGFDPSSGAGITADLKVFAAHEVYGLACATAWTVQSTIEVRRVEAADPALVSETLACLSEDFAINGIKIGMLASAGVLRAVIAWLRDYRANAPVLPVVLDPVLRSSSGRALLEPAAIPLLWEELLPLVTIATPNLDEAALLAGMPVESREAAEEAAAKILRRMGGEAGGVVVTGGDFSPRAGETGSPDDFLLEAGRGAGTWLRGNRVETRATHGTGCAFSSALLCGLVGGAELGLAAVEAKRYVEGALRAAYPVGHGKGPMHHLYTRRG